jgi:hypothetical protein
MNGFLELTGDNQRGKYVKKGLTNGIEIAADLSDAFAEVPWLGSIIKLWKIGANVIDVLFVKKVCQFLDASKGYTEKEFKTFFEEMNSHEQEVLSEFLISSISQADHRDKVTILGYIYKYRVKKEIDEEMLFRLCSAINRCYTGDLKELLKFEKEIFIRYYVADILFNVGLLTNLGIGPEDGSDLEGTRYKLSVIGKKLCDILKKENWFDDKK